MQNDVMGTLLSLLNFLLITYSYLKRKEILLIIFRLINTIISINIALDCN